MNILQARRAAATVLLAAGGLFLVAAPAQATCMLDDKGNQVCGVNQDGPTSGPGSYSGYNGVNNSTPGAIGPDGQPMTWGTPPPLGPGAAPPVPPNAAAVSGTQAHFVAPPPVTVPPANQDGTAGRSPFEYTPASPANGSASPSGASDPGAAPATSAAATAAPTPSAAPTVSATMTERAARPTRTATTSAPPAAAVPTERASATEAFNPAPLLAGIGALLIGAGLVWFIPAARAAVTSLFTRKGGH